MTLVRLDICCNDGDNGLFAGIASAIHGPDMLFELGASDFIGPRFHEEEARIKLSRRRFPFERMKYGFGNWCWNAYWFEPAIAVDLLAYAHKLGRFSIDQGESRIYAMWRHKDRLDNHDREFLEHQLIKAMLSESRP